jgi:predicted nucleic acid-binding protein
LSNNRFLLDSSAILAFIEDEEGSERVESVLSSGQALVPWIALLEVTYITRRELGPVEADRRFSYLKRLPVELLWNSDDAVVLAAARLKAENRISLADSVIAAHSLVKQATLLHKDPEFEALRGTVAMESLPYKMLKS